MNVPPTPLPPKTVDTGKATRTQKTCPFKFRSEKFIFKIQPIDFSIINDTITQHTFLCVRGCMCEIIICFRNETLHVRAWGTSDSHGTNWGSSVSLPKRTKLRPCVHTSPQPFCDTFVSREQKNHRECRYLWRMSNTGVLINEFSSHLSIKLWE